MRIIDWSSEVCSSDLMGMVHGITDLFHVAGRFAVDHDRAPIRVSHWRLQDGGGFARCFDSQPGEPADNSPAVLIAPGSLHKLLEAQWEERGLGKKCVSTG